MYQKIKEHPTTLKTYEKTLKEEGVLDDAESSRIKEEYKNKL